MRFARYQLRADLLCLGERPKKGTFKPCLRTIPYSQITGALRRHFSSPNLHAVGCLDDTSEANEVCYLIYAPRDRVAGLSKVPLEIEYLRNVQANAFVVLNEDGERLMEQFELALGGLRSRGFGNCRLQRVGILDTEQQDQIVERPEHYQLNTRLPEKHAALFGIRKVLMPVYGYLFEPTSLTSGAYVRSLFEGSIVVAPKCLLRKVR